MNIPRPRSPNLMYKIRLSILAKAPGCKCTILMTSMGSRRLATSSYCTAKVFFHAVGGPCMRASFGKAPARSHCSFDDGVFLLLQLGETARETSWRDECSPRRPHTRPPRDISWPPAEDITI